MASESMGGTMHTSTGHDGPRWQYRKRQTFATYTGINGPWERHGKYMGIVAWIMLCCIVRSSVEAYTHTYIEAARDEDRAVVPGLSLDAGVHVVRSVTILGHAVAIVGGTCNGTVNIDLGNVQADVACEQNGTSVYIGIADLVERKWLGRPRVVDNAELSSAVRNDHTAFERVASSLLVSLDVIDSGVNDTVHAVAAVAMPSVADGLVVGDGSHGGDGGDAPSTPGIYAYILSMSCSASDDGQSGSEKLSCDVTVVGEEAVVAAHADGRVVALTSAVATLEGVSWCLAGDDSDGSRSDGSFELRWALGGGFVDAEGLDVASGLTAGSDAVLLPTRGADAVVPWVAVLSVQCAANGTCSVSNVTATSVFDEENDGDAGGDGDYALVTGVAFLHTVSATIGADDVLLAVTVEADAPAAGSHLRIGDEAVFGEHGDGDDDASGTKHGQTAIVPLVIVADNNGTGRHAPVAVVSCHMMGTPHAFGPTFEAATSGARIALGKPSSQVYSVVPKHLLRFLTGVDVVTRHDVPGYTMVGVHGSFTGAVAVRGHYGVDIYEADEYAVKVADDDSGLVKRATAPRPVFLIARWDGETFDFVNVMSFGLPSTENDFAILTSLGPAFNDGGFVGSFYSSRTFAEIGTSIRVGGRVFSTKKTLVTAGVSGNQPTSVAFAFFGEEALGLHTLWGGALVGQGVAADKVPTWFVTSSSSPTDSCLTTMTEQEALALAADVFVEQPLPENADALAASDYGHVGIVRAFGDHPDVDDVSALATGTLPQKGTATLAFRIAPRGERNIWDEQVIQSVFRYRWFFVVLSSCVFAGSLVLLIKYKRGGIRATRYAHLDELTQEMDALGDEDEELGGRSAVTAAGRGMTYVDDTYAGGVRVDADTYAISGSVSAYDGLRSTTATSAAASLYASAPPEPMDGGLGAGGVRSAGSGRVRSTRGDVDEGVDGQLDESTEMGGGYIHD